MVMRPGILDSLDLLGIPINEGGIYILYIHITMPYKDMDK